MFNVMHNAVNRLCIHVIYMSRALIPTKANDPHHLIQSSGPQIDQVGEDELTLKRQWIVAYTEIG